MENGRSEKENMPKGRGEVRGRWGGGCRQGGGGVSAVRCRRAMKAGEAEPSAVLVDFYHGFSAAVSCRNIAVDMR